MKVAIIGYGYVGKNLHKAFKKNVEVLKIDPKLNSSVSELSSFKPNIVFLCLPTQMQKNGDQDTTTLIEVINHIKKIKLPSDCLIILKSTLLPKYLKLLSNIKNFIYNPEFLREKHAYEDFINSPLILFGGKSSSTKKAAEFYKKYTKCITKDYIFTDAIAASLVKYSINTFLATKTIFFNQLNDIFNNSDTKESWTNFIDIISKDSRIGSSHMHVPGHDGRKGFGGACFPKDINAFNEYSKDISTHFTLIDKVISINNKLRSGYDELTEREKEQSISFKKKS